MKELNVFMLVSIVLLSIGFIELYRKIEELQSQTTEEVKEYAEEEILDIDYQIAKDEVDQIVPKFEGTQRVVLAGAIVEVDYENGTYYVAIQEEGYGLATEEFEAVRMVVTHHLYQTLAQQ